MTAVRVVVALGVLAAQGALLVLAIARLSGVAHRWPDLLAQFTVPALWAAVVLAAGCLLFRFRLLAGTGTIVALLLLIAVWPQWAPGGAKAAAGAELIRVYSANVWARNEDADAIRRSIAEAQPDIVVLVELGPEPSRRLDQVLEGFPHRTATGLGDGGGGPARTVIASRWPVRREKVATPFLDSLTALVETPDGPVQVTGVHFTRPWPYVIEWEQVRQAQSVAAVSRERRAPLIVAGDFNSVSSARIGRQIRAEAGLTPAGGVLGTWPSRLPAPLRVTIDQVYVSPELTVVSRRIGRANGSDHLPVVTEISRSARPAG
jgi:endonuclease/exonuclease/phosphatase (EEP) superfamily protein YafD